MADAELAPIETVLEALDRASVRYLIVGGVAVVLHGHLRTTAERLRWLEEAKRTMLPWLGRARPAPAPPVART